MIDNPKLPSVFVAVPSFGHVITAQTTESLIELVQVLLVNRIVPQFGVMSRPNIAELREMMLTLWFDKSQATHMLFVDADMKFSSRLVLDMLALDKPLVGCLYPRKTLPIDWVGNYNIPKSTKESFVQVEGIGFGVTLIRRDCVQTMLDSGVAKSDENLQYHSSRKMLVEDFGLKRLIRAFRHVETDIGELTEDLSFCWRYRQCGGEIWANISHEITHVGQYGFTGAFKDQFAKAVDQ